MTSSCFWTFFLCKKNTSNANIFVIFVSSFLSNIEIVVALKYILGCVKTEFWTKKSQKIKQNMFLKKLMKIEHRRTVPKIEKIGQPILDSIKMWKFNKKTNTQQNNNKYVHFVKNFCSQKHTTFVKPRLQKQTLKPALRRGKTPHTTCKSLAKEKKRRTEITYMKERTKQ